MKTLPTPKWETVFSEATRKGFSPESIVAYGYFGSLAVGTATEESDEDIFIIVDKPVSTKKKMNRGDELDSKFFSCFDWVEDREGANCEVFFDVLAIGNIVYPKMVRREGNGFCGSTILVKKCSSPPFRTSTKRVKAGSSRLPLRL